MNAVGTKTAQSTSAVAMIGLVTSLIARLAASTGDRPSAMLRSTFSTTTMASSTTMPMASTRPNSDRLLMENPKRQHHGERADEGNRHRGERNDGGAPGLQEDDDDDDHQEDRLQQGMHHRLDGMPHENRRIINHRVIHAVGKVLFQLLPWCGGRPPRVGGRWRRAFGRWAAPRRSCCSRANAARNCPRSVRSGRRP